MADYISTLTGVQMDAALIDMAEHNSEAYAVGERNGIAVTTDDVTYHNNARYYAQQAQSIVPASVTEAVRWDVAQTALTDANREQARENIKATSHNYNLVDNGWFNVNSRNVNGAVSGGQTGLDRWVVNASASNSVTMATGSVTLPSAGYEVIQYLNDITATYGKPVTLSVRDNTGSIYSASVVMPSSPSVQNYINSTQGGIRMRLRYMNPYWWVMFDASSAGTNKVITAVKLELGSFSTLENDTLPDYATELARCIYSKANTADTYANNGFGRSNPNLLDNPFFTVNQRQVANGVVVNANNFIADRWQATGTVGATRNADGSITISNTIYYKLGFTLPIGKTVTISALYADGTIESDTFTWSGTTTRYLGSLNAVCYTGATPQQINFSAGTKNVSALKLELGTVSTLANDTPPDYGTELRKCQYYFRRYRPGSYATIGSGMAVNASTIVIFLDGEMRSNVNPTASLTGRLQFIEMLTSGPAVRDVSELAGAYYNPCGVRLLLRTTATLVTNSLVCTYSSAYDPIIDISADL